MARLCPLLGVIAGFFGLILYNEYMQPFLYSLDWSYDESACSDSTVRCTHVLAVADPQLQGYANEPAGPLGWLTRWDADHYLRSMVSRAFSRLQPDVLLLLGDLVDEAYIASPVELTHYYGRFDNIFHSSGYPSVALPGDNDIGGEGMEAQTAAHIADFEKRHGRVNDAVVEHGITFVRVNLFSLVSGTPAPIRQAMQDFVEKFEPKEHSVIVLLTHLPVYQLSTKAQEWLLANIRPDIILSAHTHIYKEHLHTLPDLPDVLEVTVPTVSYRMGTRKIGFVTLAVSADRKVSVKVNTLPPRYPQLALYAAGLVLAVLVMNAPALGRKVGPARIARWQQLGRLDSVF